MKKNKHAKTFEAYVTEKPLEDFHVFRSYVTLPFSRITRAHFRSFISAIWSNFFIMQQKQKFSFSRIPVVNVEHPLDGNITFTPGKVKTYLDFVGFFTRIFSMMIERIGGRKGLQYCADFLDFIAGLYNNAGSVYSRCMTTTDRPHYRKNLRFLIIHMFDPHLLCVPSLHVAIVAGSWAFVRKVFSDEELPVSCDEKQDILNQVYGGAAAITESVLYVKQHSINCVAAALYLLTATGGRGFFTEEDAVRLVNDLFAGQEDIRQDAKDEIRLYILNLYKEMAAAGSSSEEWQQPLLDFLKNKFSKTCF